MEIKYQFFDEECLLIQKFTGSFSMEDYFRYSGKLSYDFSKMPITKVLIDFRTLLFNDHSDELPPDFDENLEKIIEKRKKINQEIHHHKKINLVIWVDKPLPTAIIDLFVRSFSEMNYKYCSSKVKVIELLKIRSFSGSLENSIDNLEHTFSNND